MSALFLAIVLPVYPARTGVRLARATDKVIGITQKQECPMNTNMHVARRPVASVKAALPAPILSRLLLEGGGIEAIVSRDAPDLLLLTEFEREQSLRDTMVHRPAGDVWVFGYGSLVWNPAIHAAERREAQVDGWHRAFCLSITAVRGSAANPGLMLALDRGGSCLGAAYRIEEQDLAIELPLLWRREMLCGAYVPRWMEVKNKDGVAFGNAIAFTTDASSAQYVGDMDSHVVVQRLATASGGLGSGADYLFRTRDRLREHGIPDSDLEELALRVEQAQQICLVP
jgi:cation transport protein ChaC